MSQEEFLVIELPPDASPTAIEQFIRMNFDKFKPALDLDVPNPRGSIDSMDVENVEIDDDEIHVDYTFHWSVYNGCDNMNIEEDETLAICGRRDGNRLIFPIHVSPPQRSTDEEF